MSRLLANLNNEKFFLRLIKKGHLRVTKSGRAFNCITGREIALNEVGYRKLSWLNKRTGKIVQVQLHRLVWAVYKKIERADILINHKDGIFRNCRLSNLEPATVAENNKHARDTGLCNPPKGELRPNSLFTDAQVVKYRKRVKAGKLTPKEIAEKHATSKSVVSTMLNGKTYKHV